MPVTDSKDSAEKGHNPSTQNVQYAAPYPQQFEDDTIDLYELWITLWNKKLLVIGVTVIAALGSVVYALQLTPIYKAEALLLPPSATNVKSVNLQGVQGVQGVKGMTSNTAFAAFKNNLSSRSLQKEFIDEQGLMDILAPNRSPETRDIEILESFSKMMKFEDKIENRLGFSISMESEDPVFAAKLVNDYIIYFDAETIFAMSAAARNSIAGQIRDIEYTINSKRQMAKQRREDTILSFEEAAKIAAELGVRERVDTTNVVQNNQLNISSSNTQLYYRGYKALNAEMDILKVRKSDDPFIPGLRDLQERLALLRSFKIEEEGQHAVTVDQAAYPPKNRIKPNRRLIVSLGTVVGLFLGIFLVFFVSFVQKQKETHSK